MSRWTVGLTSVLLAGVIGCGGEGPVGPGSLTNAAKGKPGTPATIGVDFSNALSTYERALTDPDRNSPLSGGIIGGPFSLNGTMAGAPGSRIIKAGGAPAHLTVLDVVPDQIPFDRNCNADKETQLRSLGLVSSTNALSGTLSWFSVDEAQRLVQFRLDGIVVPGRSTPWYVAASSSTNFLASIEASGNVLTITQNYGELGIGEDTRSKDKIGFSCRGYWTITVTLPS